MRTKEKGYSLNVLVITIAVMLILTTTAVITVKNLTKDKGVTEFMNDLREVEDFVFAYFSNKDILPIVYKDGNAIPIELTEEMLVQADTKDKGNYYQVDLSKIGDMKLFDNDRGGYIINEGTLKVYVRKPLEYNGVKYYTLTDEILGIKKVYSGIEDFEVSITGNPIVWVKKFNLIVSLPQEANVDGNWTFKYYKNPKNQQPITAKDFVDKGTFFEYGNPIEITENGVYGIYVENASGYAKVHNVVVNKIDETRPYIYVDERNQIRGIDNETGILKTNYKIYGYDTIPSDIRRDDVATYMQGSKSDLPSEGGIWSYEDLYTGESMSGITPNTGKSILTYKSEYKEYLDRCAEIYESSSGEADLSVLDDEYPQFQYDGVPYDAELRNIVIYVEDVAGNYSVTNRENDRLCRVSRRMLEESNFIDAVIQPVSNVRLIINNDVEYTNSRIVDLNIMAQGANDMRMYITQSESDIPDNTDWEAFEREKNDYELSNGDGEKTVYAYVTANIIEEGVLQYKKVSDTIILDTTPPTDTAPKVEKVENDLKLFVQCKQTDATPLSVKYGYRLKDQTDYEWVYDVSGVVLEPDKKYEIVTEATDAAGNVTRSQITEIVTPTHKAKTVPNAPAMATGMKAIVWDGTLENPTEEIVINPNTWKTPSGESVVWYNYELVGNDWDNKKNVWPNAKTSDGSYWVWIPRYAYRIIYFEDAAKTTIKGFYQNDQNGEANYFRSDGTTVVTNEPETVKTKNVSIEIIFLNDATSNQYREQDVVTNAITVKELPKEYIVHPAFRGVDLGTVTNGLGRNGTELTGFWFAKFEASFQDATFNEVGSATSGIKSVPSVKSAINVNVDTADTLSKNMIAGLSSHLAKNSEWGAVAYLAYSEFGRNGNEPNLNGYLGHVAGSGGKSTSYNTGESTYTSRYAYNARDSFETSGMSATTTGNIYGVYDMVGGVKEFVAAYVANGNQNIGENGESLTQTDNPWMREVYTVGEPDSLLNNYTRMGVNDRIHGNAIYETSTGYAGTNSINGDASVFPATNNPFMTRGGSADEGKGRAGIFNFESSNGSGDNSTGFRPVISFR